MPVQLPEAFPLLRSTARNPDRFDAAVEAFRRGQEAGEIRNTVYEEAKSFLGRTVDLAWSRLVGEPHFHAGRWASQPEDVQKLHMDIMVMSLHDLLSTRKKIDRSCAAGPAVDAMNAIMAEAYPLAEVSRDLKALVIKGRAPRKEPTPVNPDKEIGTCSCCFRGIAVAGSGRMVHHGYQRPGDGYQTASCSGIRFPPLEVSTEGLEWLIRQTGEQLSALRDQIEKAPEATVVQWTERAPLNIRRHKNHLVRRECHLGEPDFPKRHANWINGLEMTAKRMETELGIYDAELSKWKPPALEGDDGASSAPSP